MPDTVVVTGATGAIPTAAAAELARRGHTARVVARDPSKVKGSEAVAGDLTDEASLVPAFRGASALVLVTNAGPDMVAKHKSALRAASAAGIRRIVRVSAWGSATDSPATLGRWHGELDAAFAAAGPDYISLQPHGFMQNTLGYAGSVKSAGSIFAPLGKGRVCYLDARDIGAVAATAATSGARGTLELTGPAAFSYDELAATLGEVLGKPIKYVDIPPEVARENLTPILPGWLVDDLLLLSKLYAANVASTPTTTVADVLGRPATTLRAFLEAHRAAFA